MDVVIENARIYTSDPDQPWADTAVIEGDRFTYVGASSGWTGERELDRVDLGGRLVIPGLIDAHTHPTPVCQSRWHVRLPWTDDVTEILDFIRDYGRAHPRSEQPFLYFEYYPSTLFAGSAPTKELLDTAISDRPVLCQDFSEHAAWANSRMIELMGVTKETPDPVPGLEMFVRDASGEPTGHLLEGVHAHFIDRMYDQLGWRPPEEVNPEALRPVLQFLSEHGVTALFEAWLADENTLRSLAALDAAGELHLYYEGAPRFRGLDDLPAVIAEVQRYQQAYGGKHIRIRSVKLFLDGTNEIGNSALLEPLAGACDHGTGEIKMDTEELTACLDICNAADVDLHIHMVGDRAFRTGCDAVQAARRNAAEAGRPWRIQVTFAHCELVDPADMARPAELGIIVNWTTHWSAGYFGEEARSHLGDRRWNRMYAFNDIAASGALLTFSSDVVTSYELPRADPFFGMQIAHTRVDPQYPLDPARYPGSVRPPAEARLPLDLLLTGYTRSGAKQLRLDHLTGSIATGKVANLVVLTDDLFAVAPDQIAAVRPRTVIFEGEVVVGSL